MQELIRFFDRVVYWVEGGQDRPAVYYIQDREAGGVLVNAPIFSPERLASLRAVAEPKFLFLPSRLGARDLAAWKSAGLQLVAYGHEGRGLEAPMDVELDSKTRFTRTIDFLPMSGRTAGTCVLRLKNKPGALFFGPALEPGADGWPTLVLHPDDHSAEARLFGVLGLQDLRYEYAFTDRFDPETTRYGPGADQAIQQAVNQFLDL
ncbi:hypothetical protein [Thermithiobacillus plumbiphilus]|uniref:Uncharacterized protein n=1 Tax=Thermithiobacillus plumbiphilus TaxID=1729899 RepID=A0ABU9D857_9PROT